jgi:hypothetical protein
MDGAKRLTTGVPFSTGDQTAVLRTRRFIVPACTTRTIVVMVDVSPDASPSGLHSLSVASVQTDVPVELSQTPGATFETKSVSQASVSATMLSLRTTPLFGSHQIVSRFQLLADDDVDIQSITLTNDGKARNTDLRNLFIQSSSGERLSATLPSLDDDTATFVFDTPLRLQSHDKRQFVVRGDVRASRKKTIRFIIEEPSDVLATPARGR